MLLPDSKKVASAILSRVDKKPMEEEVEESEEDGLDAAADEIMAALESKSAPDLKVALRSFFEMCRAEA